MTKPFSKILFFIGFTLLFTACNVTKKIPEGEYYLKSNDYEFDGPSPFKGDLESYISQKPNKRLFGFIPAKDWAYNQVPKEYDSVFMDYYSYNSNERNQPLLDSLWLRYNQPNLVGRGKWISRLLYRAGARPITLDTAKTVKSAIELEEFYFARGYFDAEVGPTYDIDSAAQKAQVTFNVKVNEPSTITDYNQVITNTKMEDLYATTLADNKVKVGERFDVKTFEAERDRLTTLFRNNGFFQFNELGNELIFKIDSTNDKRLGATMRIAKPASDSISSFQQYYLGDINLVIDHPWINSEMNNESIHMGYKMLSDQEFKLRPRVYTDAITLRSGEMYRSKDIEKTRQLILDRENYTLSSLRLEKSKENPLDSILTAFITVKPKDKYNLQLSFETMYSQFLDFGISPGLTFLTRNVFRGGENLEFSLRGTVGTVNNGLTDKNFFNAYELSFETKLNFPRWVLPFNTEGLVPKDWNPKSSISLGLSGQKNIGLGSRNYSSIMDYSWKAGMNQHRFELLNFQYIRNTEKDKYYRIFTIDNEIRSDAYEAYFNYSPDVHQLYTNGQIEDADLEYLIYEDQEFINTLPTSTYTFADYTKFRNVIFRKNSITQDVVIQSFAHNYTYNENTNKDIKHPWFINAKAEVAGALLRAVDATVGLNKEPDFFGENISLVGRVPFSEFVRLDLDVRKTFNLTPKTQLALRSFTGVALPYGNISFLPFSKSYFGGGSNDVRAWQAYALSPSPLRPNDKGTYIDQMKITWNAEYRFPLVGMMNGALFVDAGNIWSLKKENPSTQFKFDKFLSQIGVGSGFGLRFDFTFVVARLDFAYKFHDPAYAEGSKWFRDLRILRPQVQFGINYPF